MTTDVKRLPTLRLAVELRRGQSMALSSRAQELKEESRALCAEATVVGRRARQLRQAVRRRRASHSRRSLT